MPGTMHLRLLLASAAFSLTLSTPLLADSALIKKINRDNIKILDIKDGVFSYEIAGNPKSEKLSEVTQIKVDGEAAFNAAEDFFKNELWDKATTGYERTLSSTNKPWLKEWCSVRLLVSSNKAGRFDAAVRAYIALAEKSPEAAAAVTLDLPAKESKFLADAAKDLEKAIAIPKQKEPTKLLLLNLLEKVNIQSGDTAAAEKAVARAAEAAVAANPNSPEALRAKVKLSLQTTRQSVAAKDFDKAIAAIEKEAPAIIEPADQVEALLLLAEAKNGKAGDSVDANLWKDVAVSYLRVVVNAPPGSPQAAAALLRVAAIHETRLQEKPAAIRLYQQVATEYKDSESAKEAQKELKRLQG